MASPALFLFSGKGGAGKTTGAAALALALADRGRPTRVASLDPAHNLGDVFGVSLGPEATPLTPHLAALEVDLPAQVDQAIQATRDLVRQRYRYLSVGTLDPLIDLLGQAPGAEEQAAVDVMIDLAHEASQADEDLVIDLPPSGQALRMLALPALTTTWAQALLKLRSRILSRRGSIHHILKEDSPTVSAEGRALPEDPDHDPVTLTLRRHLDRHARFVQGLHRRDARVVVVSLATTICLTETRRLLEGLKAQGLPPSALVINRMPPSSEPPQGSPPPLPPWPQAPDAFLPDLEHEPRGLPDLRRLGDALAPLL